MAPTPNGELLNQILATLTSLGERLAVVEADLKTVIRDHTKDLDDHETRIRVLEAVGRQVVTRDELDEREEARKEDAQRRDNRRVAILTAVFAGAQILEGVFLYWLTVNK